MSDYVRYNDVKAAVKTLTEQGKYPARKTVRSLLGDRGSYSTIGPHINQALTELGREAEAAPPVLRIEGYRPPARDDALYAQHLNTLRREADLAAASSHLHSYLSVIRCLPDAIEAANRELTRRHRASQHGLPLASLTRPDHTRHVQALLEPITTQIQAATQLLRSIEGMEDLTSEGVTNGRPDHPDHTAA
jgi:hypothetical protein